MLIYLKMHSALKLQQQQNAIQDHLLHQQQQLILASQLAKFGSWQLDTHSQIISLSPEAENLLPDSATNPLTISQFCQLFQPEYRAALQQALAQCQEQYTAFDIECPCVLPGQASHWLRIIGRMQTDDSAQIQGVLQDTNTFHQTEMRLTLERQRFQQWADNMPIVVWTAGSDGILTYVNQVMTAYSGVASEDLLINWLDIVHPDDRERVITHWQHCLQTGDAYNIEFRCRRLDGHYVWHLTKAVAVYDNAGNIEKWLGSAMALGTVSRHHTSRV